MFPQPQNRRQYLQFGLVLLCLLCLLPTRLFLKSQKWRFPALTPKSSNPNTKRIPINNTAECRYFPEALFQFTNALHDRPESTALKPWTLSNAGPKYPTWHFPGLSSQLLHQAFRQKRIVVVGDSTLFTVVRWMQTLLHNCTAAQQDALYHLSLSQGNAVLNPEGLEQAGWANETPAELQFDDGTYLLWEGHRGETNEQACQFESIWNRVIHVRPQILVVNFGFHWLHLMGGGRNVPLCAIRAWLDYEQWLQRVVDVAQQAGVKLLLFKTTNFICTDYYWGDYSDAAALYGRQDAYILSRCKREIERLVEHKNGQMRFSDEEITRYCSKAALDEYGSKDLNHRLLEFVQKTQPTLKIMKMDVYNDHDVESCPFSEPNDGRHYHALNLMRIRLLANMIQCLYPFY
jgi:hypothetical protein